MLESPMNELLLVVRWLAWPNERSIYHENDQTLLDSLYSSAVPYSDSRSGAGATTGLRINKCEQARG